MKDKLNSLYNEEADKLLFEYLEGYLSKESAAEFEENLASNLPLQEELKHWSESYIVEDFYDTSELEEQLQQINISKKRYSAESYILIVTLITSCFSFLPFSLDRKQMQIIEVVQPKFKREISPATESITTINHQTESDAPPTAVKAGLREEYPLRINTSLTQKGDENRPEIIKPLPLNAGVSETLMLMDKNEIKGFPLVNEKLIEQKKVFSSKVTRKEQRAIERSKEKDLQKRIEEHYMRGRKPYVVPLNRNF